MEEFVVIPYAEKYEASSYGNIRNRKTGRVLKPYKRGSYRNGKRKNYMAVDLQEYGTHVVHRIVAKLFVANPRKRPCVNHIDEDTTNNAAHNLEWVTAKQNMQRYAASRGGQAYFVEQGRRGNAALRKKIEQAKQPSLDS